MELRSRVEKKKKKKGCEHSCVHVCVFVLDDGTDVGMGGAGVCQAACTWLYPTGLCTSGAEHGLVLTLISVRLVLQKGA